MQKASIDQDKTILMHTKTETELKTLLNRKVAQYNTKSFIKKDPISVPHQFTDSKDIEIIAFLTATLAWGQRKTIIAKGEDLISRMGGSPYNFVMNHSDEDLKNLEGFKHRTFNDTDLLYFVDFFKRHYSVHDSLESAFIPERGFRSIEDSLIYFEEKFFNHENAPKRTKKHVATPARNSACKRLKMFLRWMVRKDGNGVDFGIWKQIPMSELICPIDLHVERTARKLSLITRKPVDWQTALELTESLKKLDKDDPVKYDYALFGLSLGEDITSL